MNYQTTIADDPIAPELLRSRLEAIGQEAGAAVQQTAISPIVTESKDYSVTILDADGSIISATGLIEIHFGAVMNAVRTTIEVHGDTIAEGDVFIANDPHNGGGLHPQDIVIQRPVFVDGQRVAWVALAAHMMDMGGMVPGSSAVKATECYQEALRLPPVRLIRNGEECEDVWNIMRINIRSSDLIEMDMRSLVIGGAVAESKLVELVREMGLPAFRSASESLLAGVERVLRERISLLEDGHYYSTAWIEWGDDVMRVPCNLEVAGDRLIFDLSEAPPQVPFFINSKEYIIRAQLGPRTRQLIAPGLPFNQPVLDIIEIVSKPGTIVNCTMPAPIAAAHMDAAMAVFTAAGQCLQLALYASQQAQERDKQIAPSLAAYGTGRWTYLDEFGVRRVYTLIDGAFSGSPAASDRDGIDIKSSQVPGGNQLEYGDAEILEAAYPLLFLERRATTGFHGYGRYRSGAGCQQSFQAHNTDTLVGNMTGTRAWFPTGGAAGGYPGATMHFEVRRADGRVDPISIHEVGVALAPGDTFEMMCASGGGYGDPLDREPQAVLQDLRDNRVDEAIARDIYGLVIGEDGEIDAAATEHKREAIRRDRLGRASAPACPAEGTVDSDAPAVPLYPGVVQRGNLAVSEYSGAVLAVAPGNWLDGCPVLDTHVDDRAGGTIARAHLDPVSGRLLYVDVIRKGDGPGIEISPERWAKAGHNLPREGVPQ
ncbi:MAG: hydantoinase B/oxoprolinase family protein [Novosphingobium sp.]|nr:hydantoinase B/oxoprolinase family protein [Novosphingobium sp.]MCP5401869.1 hydantoinase B/oxoprolinase family protein [Novosphingobium sp.]